jgi:hypothetical protein
MNHRHDAIILALVAALALVLRTIGLQYGLPAVYNPDEVAIVARALSFAKGTLNPHNFLYPTLYFYVLFAWVGVYLGFVWLTRRVASIAALQQLYFTDPTGIYTAGRALGVACGTATVLLVHRLAARLADRRSAIAAAVFLAVSPLHVRDSHYVKHDVPATLAVVAAYLAIVRVWPCAPESGVRTRDVVLAGAACGIAFSTHYYCIFLVFPLAWAVAQSTWNAGIRQAAERLALAGAASAIVFFLLSPFIAFEPMTAWRDIAANREIVVDRAVTAGAFAPAVRYLQILWSDSVGAPVVVLAIAGAIWMLLTQPARAVLVIAFPIPFFLFISNTFPASRYLNPILPFIALLAGIAVASVAARLNSRGAVFWLLTLGSAAPALSAAVRSDLFFRQDDTRTIARRYIEATLPANASVLVQPYSVPLTPSRESLVEALTHNLGDSAAASTKFQLQLSQDPYPAPAYRLIYLGRGGLDADKIYVDYDQLGGSQGLDALRRLGIAFIVVKRYNRPDPESLPFLAALAREGRRIAVFSPYRPGVSEAERARIDPFLHNTDARIEHALARPGPPLEIWQLDGPGS